MSDYTANIHTINRLIMQKTTPCCTEKHLLICVIHHLIKIQIQTMVEHANTDVNVDIYANINTIRLEPLNIAFSTIVTNKLMKMV